jgi:hypothetical protein
VVVLALFCFGACTDKEDGIPLPTRTATESENPVTPSPDATCTPTPAAILNYRLIEGSTILSSPAPTGIAGSAHQEPLSGTFLALLEPVGEPIPNTRRLRITDFSFESLHFTFRGSEGVISGTTLEPEVSASFAGVINADSIRVSGSGFSDELHPGVFCALRLCGAPFGETSSCDAIEAGEERGYVVTLFAAPEATSLPPESALCELR